jgi:ubiquinone/menaquinone biosynthesis C-methylase UbiE
MGFAEMVTRQFGRPRGLLGALAGWRMGRTNTAVNELTLEQLDLQPGDRVLEVGFGPGVSIARAAELARDGFVAGVDASSAMVRAASRRNRRLVEAGAVELRLGTVEALPYPEESFDKVFAVNTIYFWADPAACLTAMRRALKPGGALAIGFRARQFFPPGAMPGACLYSEEEVERLLTESGIRDVHVTSRTGEQGTVSCAIGRR